MELLAVGNHKTSFDVADRITAALAKRLPQTGVEPIVGNAKGYSRHDQRTQRGAESCFINSR